MRVLLAALIFTSFVISANAQAVICPITPSAGTINQYCANTAYVAKSAGQTIVVPNVNFNVTGDTVITVRIPAAHYSVRRLAVKGLTGTFGTAKAGLYTAASAGGAVIAAQQTITISSVADNTVGDEFVLTLGLISLTETTLYLNIGTPQGAAATGNVYLYLQPES